MTEAWHVLAFWREIVAHACRIGVRIFTGGWVPAAIGASTWAVGILWSWGSDDEPSKTLVRMLMEGAIPTVLVGTLFLLLLLLCVPPRRESKLEESKRDALNCASNKLKAAQDEAQEAYAARLREIREKHATEIAKLSGEVVTANRRADQLRLVGVGLLGATLHRKLRVMPAGAVSSVLAVEPLIHMRLGEGVLRQTGRDCSLFLRELGFSSKSDFANLLGDEDLRKDLGRILGKKPKDVDLLELCTFGAWLWRSPKDEWPALESEIETAVARARQLT